jgi:hypothetical protein
MNPEGFGAYPTGYGVFPPKNKVYLTPEGILNKSRTGEIGGN